MLKIDDLSDLIKTLESNIQEKAFSFEKVGPSISLARAQRWRFDIRKDGEPVISRRYKDKAERYARQTLPLDLLISFGIDRKKSVELQKFLDRLNASVESLRLRITY